MFSDEQIEAMCEAHQDALGYEATVYRWSNQSEHARSAARLRMRAALATLPQPGAMPSREEETLLRQPVSPADELPAPGAAVRAMVAPGKAGDPSNDRLAGLPAMRAAVDGLEQISADLERIRDEHGLDEPVELPSRNDLANALAATSARFKLPHAHALELADKSIELLARRPATDVVRPVVCTTEDAVRIQARYGELGHTHFGLSDAINGILRPDAASVELPTREEIVRLLHEAWYKYPLVEAHRSHLYHLQAMADAVLTLLARRPATDVVRPEADHHAQERERLRIQFAAQAQELAELRERYPDALLQGEDLLRQVEVLRGQLAARPEPVVIDESLARRVQDAWDNASGVDAKTMLSALRQVFGDQASVTVPQGELDEAKALLQACREERFDRETERNTARADLADCQTRLKGTLALADERSNDKARVEHELLQVRAELERMRVTLREERAELTATVREYEQDEDFQSLCEQQRAELDKANANLEKTRTALETAHCELNDALGNRDLQQLREELTDCKSRLDGYQRTDRELRDKWNAELREVTRLHADLAACRMERDVFLDAHKAAAADNELRAGEYAELRAELTELRSALAECVGAMETWGSWEDGVPASDEDGEHGRVGMAYDTARMLLGYADDGKRISALLKPAPAEAAQNTGAPQETQATSQLRPHHGGQAEADTTTSAESVQHPPPEVLTREELDRLSEENEHEEDLAHPPPESAMVEQVCRNPACCPDAPWPKPRLAHDIPPPRHVSPEEMSQATEEARELRKRLDRTTAGMEGGRLGSGQDNPITPEPLPPDRHNERAAAVLAERVERLERFVNDVHAACEYPGQAAIEQIRRAAEALDAREEPDRG